MLNQSPTKEEGLPGLNQTDSRVTLVFVQEGGIPPKTPKWLKKLPSKDTSRSKGRGYLGSHTGGVKPSEMLHRIRDAGLVLSSVTIREKPSKNSTVTSFLFGTTSDMRANEQEEALRVCNLLLQRTWGLADFFRVPHNRDNTTCFVVFDSDCPKDERYFGEADPWGVRHPIPNLQAAPA